MELIVHEEVVFRCKIQDLDFGEYLHDHMLLFSLWKVFYLEVTACKAYYR